MLAVWLAGGTLALPEPTHDHDSGNHGVGRRGGGAFDPICVWNAARWSCNTLVVVPAMIHMLQQTAPSTIFPYLRLVLIGGQSVSQSTAEFLRHHFPNARIVQTHACTEAASSLTYYDLTGHDAILSSRTAQNMPDDPISGYCVGKPPVHVEIALLPIEKHDEVVKTNMMKPINKPYQVGLIATRGPHLMNGYWYRISASPVLPFNRFDWFVTNDLGAWDETGKLFFCGRASDTIRTGGETVLALEVEQILQLHPLIEEVAVFPIPDIRFGEIVACALVCVTATAGNAQTGSMDSSASNHEDSVLSLQEVRK